MTQHLRARTEKNMAALEHWMAPLFARLPHLPDQGRQTMAGIAPWLALVFGVLGLVAILSAGAIGMIVSMVSVLFIGNGLAPLMLFIGLIAGLIACVLDLMAFVPLKARRKSGWNYLFYGTVLMTVYTVLQIVFAYGTLGSLLGAFIGFWLLFEIRGLYR